MEIALFGAVVVASLALRATGRRWITNQWLDDRISNRRAGLLFALAHFAPALVLLFVVIAANPPSAPMLILAILPALVLIVGLLGAVMDYMSAHGVKDAMRRQRAITERSAGR